MRPTGCSRRSGGTLAAARRLALYAALSLLSACIGRDIEAIRVVEPVGPDFTRALTEEYRRFALFEADEMYDWPDAWHFARKGLRAADGEAVEAERLEDWRLPRETLEELGAARDSLVAALAADAREKTPETAARAQGRFDCWLEQQEENHQFDHIAACRDGFYSALKELQALLEPEPEPAPPPAPPPAPSIEERVPVAVVLFTFDSAVLDRQALGTADHVAEEAARRPAARLTLIGHADRSGPEAYNLSLSLRRAQALRHALLTRGVAAERIGVVGRGEWAPAVPTADGVAEPANRRVEVFFHEEEALTPPLSKPSGHTTGRPRASAAEPRPPVPSTAGRTPADAKPAPVASAPPVKRVSDAASLHCRHQLARGTGRRPSAERHSGRRLEKLAGAGTASIGAAPRKGGAQVTTERSPPVCLPQWRFRPRSPKIRQGLFPDTVATRSQPYPMPRV